MRAASCAQARAWARCHAADASQQRAHMGHFAACAGDTTPTLIRDTEEKIRGAFTTRAISPRCRRRATIIFTFFLRRLIFVASAL